MFDLLNRGNLPKAVEDEFQHLIATIRGVFLREHNEDGTHFIQPSGFDFVPIGSMVQWPTNTPPTGWVLCQGQPLSRVDYAALFNVIGTTYGNGDGATTFNVPDLRGRFPLGKAAAGTGSSLAGTGGALDHTHAGGAISGSTSSDGAHTHTAPAHTHTFTTGGPSALMNFLDGEQFTVQPPQDDHTHSGTTDSGGGGATSSDGAHTHAAGTLAMAATGASNPPYVVLNYIILTGRA